MNSEPELNIEITNIDDHFSNFKLIIESLGDYLKKNCQEEKLTPQAANLTANFDTKQIIDGNEKLLMNFIKLLLCISSLSSTKDKHLTKVSFLEAQTQNAYFSSVDYFLSIENNENNDKQNNSFDINNFDNLNLSESLVNDIKNLKNTIISDKTDEGQKELPKMTLGSSAFGINNPANVDDNPFENDAQSQYFGKLLEMHKSNVNNTNNLEPIKVEKKIYINPTNELPELAKNPFDKIDNTNNLDKQNLQNIISDKPQAVIVEKKTYCNIVKLGQERDKDGKITSNTGANSNKTNTNLSQVNEITLFLSGGDFLHKKINILEETLMKNSEMYNYVIDKYEKDLKILKEELENLKIKHKEEIDKLTKEKDEYINQVNDLSSLKNDNRNEIDKIKSELNSEKIKYNELLNIKINLEKEKNDNINFNNTQIEQKDKEILDLKKNIDELNRRLSKTDIENSELKKTVEELRKQKEKEMNDYQKQIKDVTFLKDQEISMLNDKIKSEQNNINDKSLLLEKNFENYKINANKIHNDLMEQNNMLKSQVEEIPFLREEVEKYKKLYENIDNENAKLHSDSINFQDRLEMGGKLNMELKQKIEILEKKLNSDPYFAKEIMSRTLYNFALRIMNENN